MNIVCWRTAYGNLTKVDGRKTVAATIGAFSGDWVKRYGWSEVVVSDGGKEFAAELTQKLRSEIVFHRMCVADSPLQNGRSAASALKQQIALAKESFEHAPPDEHDQLLWSWVLARDQHYNRSGFRSQQRVFGCMHRVPRSLCSDALSDVDTMALGTKSDFQCAHDIRTAALKAHAELDPCRQRSVPGRGPPGEARLGLCARMGRRCREGPGVVIMLI